MEDYVIKTLDDGSRVLAHHGILGMKWGVRRYQNADGSYTTAGLKRRRQFSDKDYEDMKKETQNKNIRKAYLYTKTEKFKNTRNVLNDSSTLASNAKHLSDTIYNARKKRVETDHMTNKELQDAINRMNLEDNYTRLVNNRNVSKGKVVLDNVLEIGGAVLATTATAVGIAAGIKTLRG